MKILITTDKYTNVFSIDIDIIPQTKKTPTYKAPLIKFKIKNLPCFLNKIGTTESGDAKKLNKKNTDKYIA